MASTPKRRMKYTKFKYTAFNCSLKGKHSTHLIISYHEIQMMTFLFNWHYHYGVTTSNFEFSSDIFAST